MSFCSFAFMLRPSTLVSIQLLKYEIIEQLEDKALVNESKESKW